MDEERCPVCGNVGWILDAKLDKEPTTLELMPCIYPECKYSDREVAVLCLYGDWQNPILHPQTGVVMSVSQVPRETRNLELAYRRIINERIGFTYA